MALDHVSISSAALLFIACAAITAVPSPSVLRSVHTVAALSCLLGLVGCEKDRLDRQLLELCAKDGGNKVYEVVVLPPDKGALPRIPRKEYATAADEYYVVQEVTYLKQGNPELHRSRYRIVRRSDGKTIGESIYYVRRGGDLPGPWHASSLVCPEIGSLPRLESAVFKVRDG